ncbi:hypothetical protein FQN57_002151 [Myotisia sp. PD_48]|nr:hypothetical protein FQN57_002151 [Myotisia sp. PD_48]
MEDDDSKLVAIIGGGYSGVAAYWALTHSLHDAYIFEVRGALGSLTEVTEFRLGERELMMDTALNIFNKSTSRQLFLASLDFSFSVVQKLILATANLVAFLDELGVSTCGVNFAFSSSQDRGRVEYSWGSLWRTFSSFKDAFWSLDWMLIFNIFRFNYFALDVFRPGFSELPPAAEPTSGTSTPDELDMPECIPVPILPEQTIRGYLNQRGFSSSFCVNYLVPLLCTLLNVEAGSRALDFPIKPFVRLLWDNNLLGVMSIFSPWKILGGENGDFWEIVKNRFPPSRVRLNTRVISVVAHPESSRLTVTTDSGIKQEFDHVIFAVPGQEALRLLSPLASDEEKQVLCGFKSKTIFAALHTDVEVGSSQNYNPTALPMFNTA